MKKTLAALAVLGAFAGTAAAADVTLYGVADLGLKYTYNDADNGTSSTNKLEMKSGNQAGSRFGLKGTEELGNGLKIGFVLENGFSADDGTLGQSSRLFGREANVYLTGDFGTLSFGRVGNLQSGNGSYGLTGDLSPFGTSWGGSVEGSTYFVGMTRMDNVVTYVSPSFAGVQISAQYSFNVNSKDTELGTGDALAEGKSAATRYGALGATYKNGGLKLALVADWWNWSSKNFADADDGFTVTAGGSYDFGVLKAFLGAQYFDNFYGNTNPTEDVSGVDTFSPLTIDGSAQGYAVMAGVDVPAFGGNALFAVGYTDAESANAGTADKTYDQEFSRLGASVGYTYALSKRTNVYAVGAYYEDEIRNNLDTTKNRDPKTGIVYLGLRHRF
ncbi:porin [Sutterella sp.]|uniref:porin n=1 Tax=Sutterella sp. TaxID=1981025 RepID=UPI0026DF2063|nr:porin [Sutterella sp.]MDO5531615.1 porin [Sutterella sp.]